jgi:hypothetical protein
MLKTEIDAAKRLVNTDTVQITIGEVASMYASNELNIFPEFQRLFRWSIAKKSSFIESILIGIPIPPAFAFENSDGTWELIDGLQRISTVLEFMGALRSPEGTDKTEPSRLIATKYLPSLQGLAWTSPSGPTLEKAQQLFFRRARIDFQVLKSPSDPRTKFDLFQRLNRGGAYANEQEVRTCSMVLANSNFTKAIRELAEKEFFASVFKVTPDQKLNQENLEYAVRLIVHTFRDYEKGTDVQEFLDKAILSILTDERQDEVMETAGWTVELLHTLYGDRALVPPSDTIESQGSMGNRFTLRALEGIAVGIARNRTAIQALANRDEFIRNRVRDFWQQEAVLDMSASGLRGTTRIQKTVPFGHDWFNPKR